MKKLIAFLFVCGFGVLALAATRPPSEFDLMTRLNGQPARWIMADAGVSVLTGNGQQCAPLGQYVCNTVYDPLCQADGGTPDAGPCSASVCVPSVLGQLPAGAVIKLTPDQAMNVCVRPQLDVNTGKALAWDGGCNAAPADINFGEPLQAALPYYIVVAPTATTICETSLGDAGTALFKMQ